MENVPYGFERWNRALQGGFSQNEELNHETR